MLFSLIQKATSISTCWNLPWSSKPPDQEAPLMWYSSLQIFLTYCTPVLLHVLSWMRALGVGDISDQGQLPRNTMFSTCLSPLAGPWSMSHEDHIYSELTPFQPLHVTNPYQQKYCYFTSSLILSTYSLFHCIVWIIFTKVRNDYAFQNIWRIFPWGDSLSL